ncbi:TPR-like protein [Terfezia boudieri ATCC MYA-4762]|uniref:TPR-like protein n=1 Tax=Terfezia boudieri ATCC MYA-4762 TaxID=1051890 RepID=A0A3N4LH91_9PEZI|nr:TPR-like protein [Terfezia boudieri ATCC MYA-4762]
MSPSIPQPHIITQYRNQIWHSLDNNLISTALFTAERLQAYDPKGVDSVHLLALCYFRDGQIKTAESLTRGWPKHVGCAYIYAQCCLELGGGRQKDGVAALEKCKGQWNGTSSWNKHTDTERRVLPDAASIWCLLGKLYHTDGRQKQSIEAFVQAVKLNPFIWEAFEGLLDTGIKLRVNNIFKQSPEMLAAVVQTNPTSIQEDASASVPSLHLPLKAASENIHQDPFSISTASTIAIKPEPGLFTKLNESISNGLGGGGLDADTPIATRDSHDNMMGIERQVKPPGAPLRKTRAATVDMGSRRGLTSRNAKDINNEVPKRTTSQMTAEAPATRRSTRLLNTKLTSKFVTGGSIADRSGVNAKEREAKKAKAISSRTKTVHIATVAAAEKLGKVRPLPQEAENIDVTMLDAKPLPPPVKQINEKQQEAQLHMLEMFKKLGTGYFALARYSCQEALQVFNSLTPSQRDTPWVLSKIGRAYYEMANYTEAEKIFQKIRQIDPTRTRDMEVYSTLLWHLRKDVELSYLAHELVEVDRLSPAAWCAIGNSFSLQKDHEQALKCFKRATQLDPKLAYAFTLQGHEHVSSEEYDKALVAYRSAVSADSRHYNAWYGLGKVYEKTGKYELSERHFKTAAQINPTNSVLVCCIGMVLEKTKNYKGALAQYDLACKLAPRSALSRFKKARTLMALGNNLAALQELQILKDLAPDEANVHYTLGRLYKTLKDRTNAIKHFTTALHLDPKANQLIKGAMETLEDADMEEDSEVYRLLEHS